MLHINRDDLFNMRGNRLLRTWHEVGIPPRHFRAFVAEQFCKSEFGIILLCKEARVGVAQTMKNEPVPVFGDVIIEAKLINDFLEYAIHTRQPSPRIIGEDKACMVFCKPVYEGIPNRLTQGRIPDRPTFWPSEAECIIFKVYVMGFKLCNLRKLESTLQRNEAYEPCSTAPFFNSDKYFLHLLFCNRAFLFICKEVGSLFRTSQRQN